MIWEQLDKVVYCKNEQFNSFAPETLIVQEVEPGIKFVNGTNLKKNESDTQVIIFNKEFFPISKAKEWFEKNGSKKFHDHETYEIKNVEIFSEGKWNGDMYTEKDLDEIVKSFEDTKDSLKPYLKLGHSDKQELLNSDELPAAGWVENLRKNGSKLIADFVGIPKKIYELIQAKAYKRVSIELFMNAVVNNKKYAKVLKSIALLGSATPAVQNLNDILKLYGLKTVTYSNQDETKRMDFELNDNLQIVEEKDYIIEKRENQWCLISKTSGKSLGCHDSREDALKQEQAIKANQSQKGEVKKMAISEAELEVMNKKMLALEQENKELKDKLPVFEKRNSELETEVKEVRMEKRTNEINSTIDKLVEQKKVLPAQKELLFTLLSNLKEVGEKKFKLGDAELSLEQCVLKFIEISGVSGLKTEEQTEAGEKFTNDLHAKTLKYMEDNKVSYKQALIAVSPENKPI